MGSTLTPEAFLSSANADRCPLRSSTDLTARKYDFRFAPESGLKSDIALCPKRTQKATSERGATPKVASFIDLMFPISFKPLLKYLRRCSLVNFGKLLERKRGGYTHNIGINGF